MVRPLILTLIFLALLTGVALAEPPQGQWNLADGSIRMMDCPLSFEDGGRVRMPKGCLSFDAGVLLSRSAFVKVEGDVAVLLKKEAAAAQKEKMWADRVAQLESRVQELLIKEAVEKEDYTWVLLPVGMVLGVLLVLAVEDL